MIFADSTTSTTVDVAAIADKLGSSGFIVALCLVAFVVIILAIGYVFYKLGSKLGSQLVVILENFLNGIQQSTATNAETLKNQMAISQSLKAMHTTPGGQCNVVDLREAGHSFANAVQKIGKEIGADVTEDCEKIHEKLRTTILRQ